MKKKNFNWISYLPLVVVGFGVVGSFFTLQADNTTTKAKVEELKTDLKETKETTDEKIEEVEEGNEAVEKSITEIRVQQQYISKNVEDLNDSIKELINEVKKKK